MSRLIGVFCEMGGKDILGKARELADSVGDRVVSLVSAKSSVDLQGMIYLGADEAVKFEASETSEWISALSKFVATETKLKTLIFPSNIFSNIVMGALYSLAREKVSIYLDDVDLVETNLYAKSMETLGYTFQKNTGDKIGLVSVKLSSIIPPFEDSSRNGKTRTFENREPLSGIPALLTNEMEISSEASRLTLLLGADASENISRLAEKVAEKHHATLRKNRGNIEIIYGPCMVIEETGKVRDLPQFNGGLISLNSKKSPIGTIADMVVESAEIEKILSGMI